MSFSGTITSLICAFFLLWFVAAANASVPDGPSLRTAVVMPQRLSDKLYYPGRLEQRIVDVISPVEGIVASTEKNMGQSVAKGGVLALISNDNPAYNDKPQPLVAPVAGVVQTWLVHQGERVQKASKVATLAIGVNRLIVELTGNDGDQVDVGRKAVFTVTSLGGKTRTATNGRVVALSPTIDPVTNTRRCEIELTQRPLPASGSVGPVLIEGNEHQGILISAKAVQSKDKTAYVYLIKNGKIAIRSIVLGAKHQDDVEVESGLERGDLMVVETDQPLHEGQLVSQVQARQANAQ